jgi:hypothetical protein
VIRRSSCHIELVRYRFRLFVERCAVSIAAIALSYVLSEGGSGDFRMSAEPAQISAAAGSAVDPAGAASTSLVCGTWDGRSGLESFELHQESRPAAGGSLAQPKVKRLLSSDHFSVAGTLIEAWASLKSFRR